MPSGCMTRALARGEYTGECLDPQASSLPHRAGARVGYSTKVVVRLTFSALLFDMSLVLIHSEPASISTVGWTKWHILVVESGVPRQTE